jgi:2-polyprenyl-3-methyl-5-hydroxy-6-metoxy-1,4-benzoquinol methylase
MLRIVGKALQRLSGDARADPFAEAGPKFSDDLFRPAVPKQLPSVEALESLVRNRLHTDRLQGVTPEQFRGRLDEFQRLEDFRMEGLQSAERQRDQAIKFSWGHDTDFGTFALQGQMGRNHLRVVSTFVDHLPVLSMDLSDKRILDIGVWTGGTTLLLAAMGAQVTAVEEVRKYAACLEYTCEAYGLKSVTVAPLSLYECTGPSYDDQFDYVLFPGVLYHLSDPVIALRILFNALRDGGQLLLQTTGIASNRSLCYYEGSSVFWGGNREAMTRRGWNWFLPSPPAVGSMLRDVGFEDVAVTHASRGPHYSSFSAVATRRKHVEITRAGLSVRTIR